MLLGAEAEETSFQAIGEGMLVGALITFLGYGAGFFLPQALAWFSSSREWGY